MKFVVLFFISFCAVNATLGQESVHLKEAKLELNQGRIARCLDALSQIDSSEYSGQVFHIYASAYKQLGRWNEAWHSSQLALATDSNNIGYLTTGAQSAENIGLDTVAFILWQKLVRISPEEAVYNRAFADASMKIGLLPLAIYHYEKALALNPYFINSRVRLVDLYEGLGDIPKADSIIRIGLLFEPSRRELLLLGARLWYRAEVFGRTIEYLSIADSLDYLNSDWNEIYSVSLFRNGKRDKSIEVMKRIPDNEMEESSAYVLAMAYYQTEEYDLAAQYFQMAVDLSVSENVPLYLEYKGRSLQLTENFEEAKISYERAHFYDPTDAVYTYLIARSLDESGDLDRAMDYYQSYVRETSDKESSYYEFSIDRISQLKQQFFFEGK